MEAASPNAAAAVAGPTHLQWQSHASLPPGSWVWPLCLQVLSGGGEASTASATAPFSLQGLGGPARLQLVLLAGDGAILWHQLTRIDAEGACRSVCLSMCGMHVCLYGCVC
jgi:hypothetical protein